MPNYLQNEVVLVRYPFTDLSGAKIRPAAVISAPHISVDIFIVPLTSKVDTLLDGEFVLADWRNAGLNVVTAVKRGIFTVASGIVVKKIGRLTERDSTAVKRSVRSWLGI